jgi:outer membrane protein OmpA-like peptidoglycan-associated protein
MRGGVGVGAMISGRQRAQGYGTAFMVEARPALRLHDSVAAELTASSWFFPLRDATGRATLLGGGVRFDPRLSEELSLFLDAHAGLGMTGPHNRLMFDGGAGLEYAFTDLLALGTFARYGQVLDAADSRVDAKFVAGGVYLALRVPPDQAAAPTPAPMAERPRPTRPAPLAPPPPLALTDQDNDGIADREDRCPSEPKGATPDPQRTGCPDGDDDKDGVPNGLDKCRDRAFGLNADPAAMGCSLPDRDQDTVPDLADHCPDKAGAPDTDARRNGCPGLVQIDRGTIKLLEPVSFAPGKDVMLNSSFPVLKALASALKATPGIKKLSIEGHSDGTETEQNPQLSQSRADSILRWLSQNGVAAERLEAKGFGDTRPLATNKTAKGRAENRRVELIIVDPPTVLP